ncbi:MAG: Flp family type IVb pilin [Sphingosinicella sp.]|nr:Flp family type IVb pilin [Sphingosinicella sp.]
MIVIRELVGNKRGATAIEYGFVAALIAVSAISAMGVIGGHLINSFTEVGEAFNDSIGS